MHDNPNERRWEIAVANLPRLTPKHAEVVEWFRHEPHDAVIAKRMGLKTQTVRNYIAQIHRTLGVRSRAELMQVLQEAKRRDEPPGEAG